MNSYDIQVWSKYIGKNVLPDLEMEIISAILWMCNIWNNSLLFKMCFFFKTPREVKWDHLMGKSNCCIRMRTKIQIPRNRMRTWVWSHMPAQLGLQVETRGSPGLAAHPALISGKWGAFSTQNNSQWHAHKAISSGQLFHREPLFRWL